MEVYSAVSNGVDFALSLMASEGGQFCLFAFGALPSAPLFLPRSEIAETRSRTSRMIFHNQ